MEALKHSHAYIPRIYLHLFLVPSKKLKDIAFPRTDELKKDLLKKYSAEYQEYMQDKVKSSDNYHNESI